MIRYLRCAICGEERWEGSNANPCKPGFYDHTWVEAPAPGSVYSEVCDTHGPYDPYVGCVQCDPSPYHGPGSQPWMADLMEDIFDEIREVRKAGQSEYAREQGNAFANFERAASDLPGVTREQVLWVFAMKHRDGIASWLGGHQSQREDVRGRIKDLIMYLILLWGMVEEGEAA